MRQAPRKFKMDFVQKVTLSPIEKYVLYNRFPWKLVVHILLLVFTTYQALQMVNQKAAHGRAEHMVLKKVLLDSDDDSDLIDFFSLQEFSDQLGTMTTNLQSLNDQLIQEVDTSQAEYEMNVYYRELNLDNIQKTNFPIDINEGIVSPFHADNITEIKEFLSGVAMFQINGYGILNLVNYVDSVGPKTCMNWTFSIKYDFQSFANIQATIDTGTHNCVDIESDIYGQNLLLIHVIVILLAFIGLALSWKHIYHTGAEYMHQRSVYRQVKDYVHHSETQQHPESSQQTPLHGPSHPSPDLVAQQYGLDFQQTWDQLGVMEKIPFFDMWFIISVLGNFIQIVGSVIAVIDCLADVDLSIFKFQEALVGLGCMVAWLMMLKYLEYNPNINLMTSTLRLASSNIVMFMIGVMPFFFGFVFLGQCIFWRFEKFSSTLNSIITLFALSNGDIVSDTFMDTWSSGVLGQLFLVIFMILFFTAVQNVFITIIMEGFEENRKQKQLQNKKDQQAQSPIRQRMQDTQHDLVYVEDEQRQLITTSDPQRSPQSMKPALLMEMGDHTDDKEMVIGKLKLNTKRVERMLEEMDSLLDEIDKSRLKQDEKAYLLSVYRENVENISRNIKFQLSNIGS